MTLSVHHLSCVRAERVLFSNLNLEIRAGSALWVRGSNGSGKTSLLRMLCGLAYPDDGKVCWQGRNIRANRAELNASLIYIGHAAGLKDDLVAWENVVHSAIVSGSPVNRDQAFAALDLAGLSNESNLSARVLSVGQRKRVNLARLSFGSDRPLWILDEPFTSLDGPGIGSLRAILEDHLSNGGIVIYTTHQDISLLNTMQFDMDRGTGC